VGVQTNYRNDNVNDPYPSVHAPWYGYLLFNEATKGDNVRFMYNERDKASTCNGAVKVRGRGRGAVAAVGVVWSLVPRSSALLPPSPGSTLKPPLSPRHLHPR
jgi:hypothetical protein